LRKDKTMADFSVTPVATQIKPMPTMSLGEMINFARGAQQYQREGISLTLEQQQEAERKRITDFLSRPENYQTEGRVDINKLNAEIPRIAPLTGADWMQKYTTLGNAQTQAISAAQNLTQTQREMIASRLAIMGRLGVNDKRAYLAELDQLVKENPNNPDLARLVDSYKTTMNVLPENANLPQLAISGANSLLNPQTQQQLFAPQACTATTGAATFPTTTRPSVAGEAPVISVGPSPLVTAQLPPGQREVFSGQYDQNNMPIVNVYDASGRFLGQRSAGETPPATALPGMNQPRPVEPAPAASPPVTTGGPQTFAVPPAPNVQPVPLAPVNQPQPPRVAPPAVGGTTAVARIRPGETAQTVEQANALRNNSANAAAQVPLQSFNNNQIIKLADDVITGRGANFIGALTGGYAALPFTTDNATNLNQLGHYMALQTASLAQSSGLGGTDAARGIAGEISGTTSWTAPAIKQTARVNRALSTATDLFNQGVQSEFARTKDPLSARDFQNKWSQTVDINAVRLYDAMRNNDKEAIREVVAAAGGPNSPGYKRLVDNIGAMQRLIKGQ
jgi:hypothetical protein